MRKFTVTPKYNISAGMEVVLSSPLFDLVKRSGIGMNNTPWTGYEVVSKGAAERWVVQIRLDAKWAQWIGQPIEMEYLYAYVSYGIPGEVRRDISEFITVLQAAQDFCDKVEQFLGL